MNNQKTIANETTAETNTELQQAGLAQCLFIALQSFAFPELGIPGAIIAALCAMMPWLVKYASKKPSKVFGMMMASFVLSPIYSVFCQWVISTW